MADRYRLVDEETGRAACLIIESALGLAATLAEDLLALGAMVDADWLPRLFWNAAARVASAPTPTERERGEVETLLALLRLDDARGDAIHEWDGLKLDPTGSPDDWGG